MPHSVPGAKSILAYVLLIGWIPLNIRPLIGQESLIEFNRDIRPILSDRCFKCHGPDDKKREGEIRFDLEKEAKKDLGGYRAIIPGDPQGSELVRRIFSDDPDEIMPPGLSGKSLSTAEKGLLKKWIAQGANFQKHWAFRKPVRPPLPVVQNKQWSSNEIDLFVLGKLEQHQVQPSPEANQRTLVRRLHLDLVGLLPSPKEVDNYVADKSGQAYEKLVDRLLASKHFGERMGRHWLDLARYADSNGYANDGLRSVWPYRDWVINAINADMPFDQFTIEQLAGDLLPKANQSQKIATGFHRNTPHQTEGGSDPEQYRVERTKNRTDTTGAVWLGLTVGCAQCHSHKFDPISHAEYYSLYAFFNNTDEPTLTVAPSTKIKGQIEKLTEEIKVLNARLSVAAKPQKVTGEKTPELDWKNIKFKSIKSLQGATLKQFGDLTVLATGKNPQQDTYVLQFDSLKPFQSIRMETMTDPSLPRNGPGRASNGNFVLAELKIQSNGKPVKIVAGIADHSQKNYHVNGAFDGDFKTGWAINTSGGKLNQNRTALFAFEKPVSGQVQMTITSYEQGNGYNIGKFRVSTSDKTPVTIDPRTVEMQKLLKLKQNELTGLKKNVSKTLAISERAKPRETFVQIRGDFLDRGEKVVPATFSALHPLSSNPNSGLRQPNRLDLGKWIMSNENPLTARVVVNRIWQRMFGTGLVKTENDFGYQGSLPTHPGLLDYLAKDLMEHQWKMKRMYKKIAMSSTYRQSSKFREKLFLKDPTNQWLARQNRYRVEGEIVRDLALSASGLLSRKMGGPSVFPPIPPNVIGTSSANHRWPESKTEDRYRRGIYIAIYRANVYPMLSVFDGPDRDNPCTRRTLSNTPLQALTIANDASFMEMARAFGKRIMAESSTEQPLARIKTAYQIGTGRNPTKNESVRLNHYFDAMETFYRSHPQESVQIAGESDPQLAAWVCVARVILNLDEFITRE